MNTYKSIIKGEIRNTKMFKIPCLWLVEYNLLNSVTRPAGRGSIFNKARNTIKIAWTSSVFKSSCRF